MCIRVYGIIIYKITSGKKTLMKKLSDQNKDSSRWKCEKPNSECECKKGECV